MIKPIFYELLTLKLLKGEKTAAQENRFHRYPIVSKNDFEITQKLMKIIPNSAISVNSCNLFTMPIKLNLKTFTFI